MSTQVLKKLLARKRREALPCKAMQSASLNRYDVSNFYFGAQESGKSLSRTLSAICLVRRRLSRRELNKQQTTCLSKIIVCTSINNMGRFKTDVQTLGGRFAELAAVMNPRDIIVGSAGQAFGTIGLFGRHPDSGVVCTTAGHVVRDILAEGNLPGDLFLRDREQNAELACTAELGVAHGQTDCALLWN